MLTVYHLTASLIKVLRGHRRGSVLAAINGTIDTNGHSGRAVRLVDKCSLGGVIASDITQTKFFSKMIAGAVGESHDRMRRCFLRVSYEAGCIHN